MNEELIDVYKCIIEGVEYYTLTMEQDEVPEGTYVEMVKMTPMEYQLIPEINGF